MNMIEIYSKVASEAALRSAQVKATHQLILDACTTPFIARYRKEVTGGLDEVQIDFIRERVQQLEALVKRKQSILETIAEQGKLTPILQQQIEQCWEESVLEDLYLPYKPKRKTRASVAKERGLEPLALWILTASNGSVQTEANKYLNKEVVDVEAALQGARDIIAETINEDANIRQRLRNMFERNALVSTKVMKGKEQEGAKYRDYFQFEQHAAKCPSHRLLAILRAEEEGFIRVSIEPDLQEAVDKIAPIYIKRFNECGKQIAMALEDSCKRLLFPSLENEYRKMLKAKADEEAINVFAENVKQLLMSAPLGSKKIMGIDPGFRSGCKVVCLSKEGNLLADAVVYPHEPQFQIAQASATLQQLLSAYQIEAIAIGNGTAGRETELWIKSLGLPSQIQVFMVNENGASVYSASAVGREEFPNHDITVRGAVSIGRRLADPLAELVKIDPKSIGVGQYQHDVDQSKLKHKLDAVVVSCVNQVGVNVNTASKSLLTYVSGLNQTLAQNIVDYIKENGAIKSRTQLKKIPRLGPKAFEQCAAFLRIPDSKNILDNTAVHPESYEVVEAMARQQQCKVEDLIKPALLSKVNLQALANEQVGMFTLKDILQELSKPGRDPRPQIEAFSFADVKSVNDLYEGMVLPGIVTNITRFGCFVDIGVKQDGMVHISQMANKYVSDPNTIVKLQQQVRVKVLEVDHERKRISLSMKEL
jgi:protein Tex